MPSRRCSAVAALLVLCGTAAGQFYEYKIIAKVGQAGLTGMGDGPSISYNTTSDQSPVAFIGQTQGVDDKFEGVFVGDGSGSPVNIAPTFTDDLDNIAPSCQMNDVGQIIARTSKPNPNGPAFSYIWRWDVHAPDSPINIADSVNQNPFRAVNPDPTMNFSGKAVWSGLDPDVKKILVTGAPGNYTTRQLPSTPVRPMLSDFGQVVTRLGNSPTDPISLLNASLTKVGDIATSPNFSNLGQSPGISTDAQIVVFSGTLTQPGADAINAAQVNWDYGANGKAIFATLKPGAGIFASVLTDLGRVVVRIAGEAGNGILDPGEFYDDLNKNGVFDPATETDEGPCASFPYPDGRIAVDGDVDKQRAVTVCYLAADSQGRQTLFSNRLNIFGSTAAPVFKKTQPGAFVCGYTTTVVRAGQTIAGLSGTVESIGIYDPLNGRDRGDIGFYAKTSSSAGIVRARPVQVVFLDFDPVHNFRLTPDNAGLFSALGCAAQWEGNMDFTFQSMAPARNDLNSAGALKTIQDGIVDLVQQSYDHLVVGGDGVRMKVFGKQGEQAPTGGPFIRVYIGDSPFNNNNNNGTSGIAMLDLWNQKCSVWTRNNGAKLTKIFAVQGTPLITIDNSLRKRNNLFTTEDPANLSAIGLDDTGPHKVTVQQVINAIGTTAAHELGHNLGLSHLDNNLDDLLMNTFTSSPLSDNHAKDELRYPQVFGVADQKLDAGENHTQNENSGRRLALTVGSDTIPDVLPRDQPPPEVEKEMNRTRFRATVNLGAPVSVARAGVGIVPFGIAHSAPEFFDLGAGDLETLLDVDLEIGPRDQVILIASTDGQGIDIFGVNAGFGGDVKTIDVSDALLIMADGRLRATPLDDNGAPVAKALDIYQDKPNGQRAKIGSIGDPAGNPGPLAKNDTADAAAGQPVVISILANDTDPDGLDKSSVAIVLAAAHGAAAADPVTGKVTYRSETAFDGIDTFRYTVRDSKGAVSNEATVTVTVSGGDCYADFTGDGTLDLFDFLGFTNAFNAKDQSADCVDDNVFDLFDFLCFVNEFNAGC